MSLGNDRGMALLLVLVVISLLSILLSEFAFSTLVDMRLAETFRDTTRAEYLARGGITAGRMIIHADDNSYDAIEPSELWSVGVTEYPLAQGSISVKIEDLDGRLLLNNLVDTLGNPNPLYRDRFVRLCTELNIDNPEDLADALIDWIDPDSESISVAGAEDSDYLARHRPYEAADTALQSLDELVLIRGFSGEIVIRLRPYVSAFGSGLLNVNTASEELLRSWDEEGADGVESLISGRKEGAFERLDEARSVMGVDAYTALNRNLDLSVTSTYYLINSTGQINDGTHRMQAVVEKEKDQILWQKVN